MLKKANRLTSDKVIKKAALRGRNFFSPYLSIKFSKLVTGPRFAVVVSTKVSKKAVVRNRLKRLIREAIRLNISKFEQGNYLIILKPASKDLEGSRLISEFFILARKGKLI